MPKYTIKDSELKSLLDEVEAELVPFLKSQSERLAKASDPDGDGDEDSSPAGEDSAGGPPPEASASAPEASASEPVPPSAEGSAEMPEASAAAPGEAPGEAPGADPAMDQGPLDPESLKAEYAQLPPEELKMHYVAAKAALFELMGQGAGPDAGAGAPPGAGAGAPPPPMAPPGPEASASAPALKAELKASPGNGGDALKVKKSENDELEALKKSNAEMNDMLAVLAKAVESKLVVERKAVTGVNAITKPADAPTDVSTLSKSEIAARINKHAMSPLTKNEDRDLINAYLCKEVSVEKIAHLLK